MELRRQMVEQIADRAMDRECGDQMVVIKHERNFAREGSQSIDPGGYNGFNRWRWPEV
jgi:hypothetical protein